MSLKVKYGLPVAGLLLGSPLAFAFDNGVNPTYEAPWTSTTPTVDGFAADQAWQAAEWRDIGYTIIDTAGAGEPAPEDISGRYKVVWTNSALYLLAEVNDDQLVDAYANPFDNWWNEDTLEIFIDEDNSGGYHGWEPVAGSPMLEHNAYAYHIGLDNQALDVGPNFDATVSGPQFYPDHVYAQWKRDPETHKVIWEVKINVYNDQYLPPAPGSSSITSEANLVKLKEGNTLGFMVSLIDADGVDLDGVEGQDREYFLGDVDVPAWQPSDGGYPMPDWMQKNRGWVDADVFGNLKLVKK